MQIGYFLSCAEYGPAELLAQAAATSAEFYRDKVLPRLREIA